MKILRMLECKKSWRTLLLFTFVILCISKNILASGPQFTTSDAAPTPLKEFDNYLYITRIKNNSGTTYQAPALEIHYGLFTNLEINTIAALIKNVPSNHGGAPALGDLALGVVYRFLDRDQGQIQMSFAPIVTVPTGNVNRNTGNGKTIVTFPIWAQKSWQDNAWETYGGGGYTLNPAAYNFFYAGWALEHDVTPKLRLGGEIFTQGANSSEVSASTLLNVGGYYTLAKDVTLLFSIGHTFLGYNNFTSFLGINWTV